MWLNKVQVCLQKRTIKEPQIMKRILLAAFGISLIGCAQQAAPPSVTTGYTYSRYSTSAEVWGYRNPIYRNWTTAQLQQRGEKGRPGDQRHPERNDAELVAAGAILRPKTKQFTSRQTQQDQTTSNLKIGDRNPKRCENNFPEKNKADRHT